MPDPGLQIVRGDTQRLLCPVKPAHGFFTGQQHFVHRHRRMLRNNPGQLDVMNGIPRHKKTIYLFRIDPPPLFSAVRLAQKIAVMQKLRRNTQQPVSYTHLTTRNVTTANTPQAAFSHRFQNCTIGEFLAEKKPRLTTERANAVSYTHLDVYKRQFQSR